jgi:hypothetical protein
MYERILWRVCGDAWLVLVACREMLVQHKSTQEQGQRLNSDEANAKAI